MGRRGGKMELRTYIFQERLSRSLTGDHSACFTPWFLCRAALGCDSKLISMACMSSDNTCWVINAELGLSALPPLFTCCAIPCNSLGHKSSTELCQPVKDPFPYSSTSTPVHWLPEMCEIVKYQNRPLCPTCSCRICFSAPNSVAIGKEKSSVQASSCLDWTWKFGCKCWFMVAFLFWRPLPSGNSCGTVLSAWTWSWCRDVTSPS